MSVLQKRTEVSEYFVWQPASMSLSEIHLNPCRSHGKESSSSFGSRRLKLYSCSAREGELWAEHSTDGSHNLTDKTAACLGQNRVQRWISKSAAARWVQGQAKKSDQWVWIAFTEVQAQAQTELLHSCSVMQVGAVLRLSLQAALKGKEEQDLVPSFPHRSSYHQSPAWTQTAELSVAFQVEFLKAGWALGPNSWNAGKLGSNHKASMSLICFWEASNFIINSEGCSTSSTQYTELPTITSADTVTN